MLSTSDLRFEHSVMYKGVEICMSDSVNILFEDRKHLTDMLEVFFNTNPANSIRWVTLEDINSDDVLPMYSVGNGVIVLLLWPHLDKENSDLFLNIESLDERPDLEDEILEQADYNYDNNQKEFENN